jgi:hypothetical protein
LVLFPLFLAVALWPIVGVGTILYIASAPAVVLSAVYFLVMAVSQKAARCHCRRRIRLPQTFRWPVAQAGRHRDGHFAVIKIDWSRHVVYKLTAEYRARVGQKPAFLFQGYDEVAVGTSSFPLKS